MSNNYYFPSVSNHYSFRSVSIGSCLILSSLCPMLAVLFLSILSDDSSLILSTLRPVIPNSFQCVYNDPCLFFPGCVKRFLSHSVPSCVQLFQCCPVSSNSGVVFNVLLRPVLGDPCLKFNELFLLCPESSIPVSCSIVLDLYKVH